MSFFEELRRRNVLRVAVAYIVGAWLLIQVAETIFPLFGFDDTPARIVVVALAILFVPAVIILWKLGAGWASVFPPFGYATLIPEMVQALPSYFDPFSTVNGTIPLTPKFYTAIMLSIAFGTIGLPHIAMRYFTAPSVRDARSCRRRCSA